MISISLLPCRKLWSERRFTFAKFFANAAKAAPVAANSVAFGVFPQVRFSPIPLCPGGSP